VDGRTGEDVRRHQQYRYTSLYTALLLLLLLLLLLPRAPR